jgi:hypothetical protein
MSHFAVLVLHEEDQFIEDLLAPYDENLEVEPYIKYTRIQAINKMRKDCPSLYKDKSEDEIFQEACDWFGCTLDDDNNLLSTYNPHSKWDWWQVGGRFSGILPIIPTALDGYHGAEYVDSAFVRHIKWVQPLDKEKREDIIKWWNVNIEGAEGEKDECFLYNPEYYKERYKDVETYIKTRELPCYHAVVTPDGIWHEPSKVGWWGCTNGNPSDELEWDLHFKERFIDTAEFDWVATIVDCHI